MMSQKDVEQEDDDEQDFFVCGACGEPFLEEMELDAHARKERAGRCRNF